MYKIGDIVKIKEFEIDNQVGGTEILRSTVYAKIKKSFNDNETGQRFIGELFREKDIKVFMEAGKTECTPEHFKKYGEKLYRETLKAYKEYDPKKVYFSQHDIISTVE